MVFVDTPNHEFTDAEKEDVKNFISELKASMLVEVGPPPKTKKKD